MNIFYMLSGVLTTTVQDSNSDLPDAKETVDWISKMLNNLKENAVDILLRILFLILIIFIGRKIIKWIQNIIGRAFNRSKLDESVSGFLLALAKVALNAILIIIVASYLGLDSSLVALVGSAGLTLGLALQGSLANFAGGVLILVMRPFKVGDYIVVEGEEGTVTGIDIFYTRILTMDNRMVVMPNGNVSNASITNVTNETLRKMDLSIPISYSEDIHRVKHVLEQLVMGNELVLKDHDINIFVKNFGESSITIGVRLWVEQDYYWPLRWKLLEDIKYAFDENGIEFPYNKLDVNVIK